MTHLNPYTGNEYRNEPAIAIVEMLNENALYLGFRAPTPYYDEELTRIFNLWLQQKRNPEELKKLRELAAVAEGAPIPRLKGQETAAAPRERYATEMAFYTDARNQVLPGHERVSEEGPRCESARSPAPPTTAIPAVPTPCWPRSPKLDILDGHVYWQHPGSPPPVNTPMVNDPFNSTIVQLSRTAFAGKPYTVSETNHPFPNDWAAEGIPILAAYGSFQDWDAIIMYTFEPKRDPNWKPYVGDPFDISLDPVRMTQMAAGALTFLRGDVRAARETVARTYSKDQVLDSRRLPRTEQPYFTPGFPLALPLQHAVRIQSLDGAPTAKFAAVEANPLRSDTKELAWYTSPKTGLVTVETDRTQALIGFIPANAKSLKNLSADISTQFASHRTLIAGCETAFPVRQNAAHRRIARHQHGPEMERRSYPHGESG